MTAAVRLRINIQKKEETLRMFFCNVAIAASSKAALKQSYFSKKCTHVNLQLSKKK